MEMVNLSRVGPRVGFWVAAWAAGVLAVSCVPTDDVVWIGFSPSDRYLASATRGGKLRILDTQTRETREVSAEAASGGFQWAPDADRLVFCLRRQGQWDLALAEPDGKITPLMRDEWRDFQPTWSPDGRGIYYATSRGGGYHGDYDIRYYDVARKHSHALISGPHDQVEPRISPDGRWLATVSYQRGNPLILIQAVKTLRVIRIPPPPNLRSGRLHSPVWLGDSRHLACPIEDHRGHHLAVCEIETETWRVLESSPLPYESLVLDRQGRNLLYVCGGKAYRRRLNARWGRRRLDFDGLPVTSLAVRHGDDRLGAVVAGGLIGIASASGEDVSPLPGLEEEYLFWGDLELLRGRKRQGFRYYETALARARQNAGEDAEAAAARIKLSRAPLLCRLGHSRTASAYLRDARDQLEDTLDKDARKRLHVLFALNEFIWHDRREVARAWLLEVTSNETTGATEDDASLLLRVVQHPDTRMRKAIRRGVAAFWQGKTEKGIETFVRLLQSRPADPLVQAVYRRAWVDQFALSLEGVFEPPAVEERRRKALAAMAARYLTIADERFEMDREWFDALAGSLLTLRDADGLKQLGLQHGLKFLNREETLGLYRRYWRPGEPEGRRDAAAEETLATVLFDDRILAAVQKAFPRPQDRADVRLASARRALVSGEYDRMKRILRELARDLENLGTERVFGTDGERAIAYSILAGALAEREGTWEKAVERYREASAQLERLTKPQADNPSAAARAQAVLGETRFRADLLQRGAAVRDDLGELLTIERAVGDYLMTYSHDPTSLINGIHNYFALLARVGAPWVKDLIYLRAGQSFLRLDRWGEAAFCLRVAHQSKQRFIADRARAELAELFAGLEDPGLAHWYSRH